MEAFEAALVHASEKLRNAEYHISRAFPLVQDPTIIVTALKMLSEAQLASVEAIVAYERLYKRIPSFDTSESIVSVFEQQYIKRKRMSEDIMAQIRETQQWANAAKQAKGISVTNDTFSIGSAAFSETSLRISRLKTFLGTTKKLFAHAKEVTHRE